MRREIGHRGLAGLLCAPYPGSEEAEASGRPRGDGREAGAGPPGAPLRARAGVRRAAAAAAARSAAPGEGADLAPGTLFLRDGGAPVPHFSARRVLGELASRQSDRNT